MRNRRRQRHDELMHDLPLTPLIDTALTLVIICMLAAPLVHNSITVQLPHGQAREQQEQSEGITVHIAADDTLYLNDKQVALSDLLLQLSGLAVDNAQGLVRVYADTAVNYGAVVQVVDRLKKAAGVTQVALVTKRA